VGVGGACGNRFPRVRVGKKLGHWEEARALKSKRNAGTNTERNSERE